MARKRGGAILDLVALAEDCDQVTLHVPNVDQMVGGDVRGANDVLGFGRERRMRPLCKRHSHGLDRRRDASAQHACDAD